MNKAIKDLTGQRFGRLIVIKDSGRRHNSGTVVWLCKCDCGGTAEVAGYSLKNGHTQSCSCLNREINLKQFTTHGMSRSRPNKIWRLMKNRCLNTKADGYSDYGGRGIKVCDRWLIFSNFWEDMKDGYSSELSIDRIDNNKGYYKENCRWANKKEQANNSRHNHLITYKGQTMNITQWAEMLGMNASTLSHRITDYGWSSEKAIKQPVRN